MRDPSPSPEAFAKFLGQLDPDPDCAGAKYVSLGKRLAKFFEYRGVGQLDPASLVDWTFNRAARLVWEGRATLQEDAYRFLHRVAGYILLEFLAEQPHVPPIPPRPSVDDREQVAACLDECMAHLRTQDRQLILQYYHGELIPNRERLAATLGINMNTLRIKALRVRERLEACVGACMKKM